MSASVEIAAWIAAALIAGLVVFQLALALGAPAGAAAWGGSHPGVLPIRLRVASAVVGLFFYPAVAAAILGAAGVLGGPSLGRPGMWVFAGIFILAAIANLVSRSKVERLWSPVALAIAVCCATVALGL